MKLYGTLSELVAAVFRKGGKEVRVEPATQTGSGPIVITIPNVGTNAASLVTTGDTGSVTSAMIAFETIVNDDISTTAAIARSKLASGTINQVIINDGSGVLSSEATLAKTRGGTGITSTATFPASGTVAVTGDKLSAFAATTSAELAGVISDETGSGALVFGTSPTLTTPSISLATLSSYSTTTAAANSTITPAADRPVIVLNVLTSSTINSVANPANGKQVFLVNSALGDLTINDNSGSPATNGIRTGTGQSFTLKSNASVSLLYNSDMNRWTLSGGAGGSGGALIRVNGGAGGYPVGTPVYYSGVTVLPANASAANTAEVIGLVSAEPTSGVYDVLLIGEIGVVSASAYDTGVAAAAGTVLFLSPTAGKLTAVEPTIIGQVSVPLAVSQGGTGVTVAVKRGVVLGGTNARTQLNLASASPTAIFNAASPSLYTAGELTGWVQLGTSQKFYFRAPFAQNGGSTDWNISPSYVGDTPPAGFSITVASSGVITMTCPTFTGTGLVNYALNAPAVGATFPLAVDGGSLTTGTVAEARLPNTYSGLLTLNGGALNTGLTGTAATTAVTAGSGKVGEVISSVSSASLNQLTPTLSTWYFVAGMPSITLSAGIWSLMGFALIEGLGTFTAVNFGATGLRVYNTTTSSAIGLGNLGTTQQGATTNLAGGITVNSVLTVPSATSYTYQLQMQSFAWSGTPTFSNIKMRGDISYSVLYATRIA